MNQENGVVYRHSEGVFLQKRRDRASDKPGFAAPPEGVRDYLHMLAGMHIDSRLPRDCETPPVPVAGGKPTPITVEIVEATAKTPTEKP